MIFIDANIFNDLFDPSRSSHAESRVALTLAIESGRELCTSCDIATTVYYITAKNIGRVRALEALEDVKKMVKILPFGEAELSESIELMKSDTDYKDLEDAIQYVMAQKAGCEVIVSNDKNFVSKKIPLMSSEEFVKAHRKTSGGGRS